MNLTELEGLYQHTGFRHAMGVKIGLLVSLMGGALVILFITGGENSDHFAGVAWRLDLFIVSVIAVSVIAITGLIVRQMRTAFTRYTEFIDKLGDDGVPDLMVEPGSKALQKLGTALNNAHRRLQQNDVRSQLELASHHRFSRLVEESPNIVLLMNADGKIKYLNKRGRQVADAVVPGGEDLSVILPQTPAALVEKCIVNNETLLEQTVNYRDRKFLWTLMPHKDEQMLQAYGTVVPRRRKVDYQPLDSGAEGAPSQLYSIATHPDYQRYRGSILIIDGDDVMQSLMSRYFRKEGFRVFSARSGEEGVEMAERYKPDLITLDIMMPGKNGWMVLSTLKDRPAVASIPVVIVSSVGNKRFVHAMGADDYVTKPVDWKTLGKIVNKLSGNHRKSGAL